MNKLVLKRFFKYEILQDAQTSIDCIATVATGNTVFITKRTTNVRKLRFDARISWKAAQRVLCVRFTKLKVFFFYSTRKKRNFCFLLLLRK